MRKKIVAGNWKMNKSYEEGLALTSEIVNMLTDEQRNDCLVIIACPFIHTKSVSQLSSSNKSVKVAGQNCHQENSGAYTGEISAAMLKSAGADYVILGHSERRLYGGENEVLLKKKVDSALGAQLIPIFCIGETKEQRESGEYFTVIKNQLAGGLYHLSEQDFSKLILAYEPVWAIGTGLTASPAQAQEVHAFIRKEIEIEYGVSVAENCSILYGGSCNPGNAATLFAEKDIDGGLIGGASLKSRDFVDIIQAIG